VQDERPFCYRPLSPLNTRKYLALAALAVWVLILYATHLGGWSPYSYGWAMFQRPSDRLFGRVVNTDALQMVPAMHFFYDGETPAKWEEVTNLRLPLHPFIVATIASFTRSYLLANDIANIGALLLLLLVALNAAERRQLQRMPVVMGLMTLLALPFVATYIAQPMQYIVGTSINFLAIIALFALSDDDVRRPLIAAIPVAVMLLNYDPYIYVLAAVLYILAFVRFRSALDYLIFLVVAVTPAFLWTQVIRAVTNDRLSQVNESRFIRPVIGNWYEFLLHPMHNAIAPYLAGHIGLHIGAHMVLTAIYWPILLTCAVALWQLRDKVPHAHRAILIALLVLAFVIHQIATAAFDWENNPRRALPFLLAFAFAYLWAANETWSSRGWRITLTVLLIIGAVLTMSDRLFRVPVLTYLPTQQAMQRNPKDSMETFRDLRLDKQSMPDWMTDEKIVWHDLGRAQLQRGVAPAFFLLQVLLALSCCALLWLLARAELLPRHSAAIGAIVWIASAIRFIG
jgi:hypothetical protein